MNALKETFRLIKGWSKRVVISRNFRTQYRVSNVQLLRHNARALVMSRLTSRDIERDVLWRAYRATILSRAVVVLKIAFVLLNIALLIVISHFTTVNTATHMLALTVFVLVFNIIPIIFSIFNELDMDNVATLARWTEQMLVQNHCPSCGYPITFDSTETRKALCPECGIEYSQVPISSLPLEDDAWQSNLDSPYTRDMLLVQSNARNLLRHRWNISRPERIVLWQAYFGVILSRIVSIQMGKTLVSSVLLIVLQIYMLPNINNFIIAMSFVWAATLVLPILGEVIQGVNVDNPKDVVQWTKRMLTLRHCPSCGTPLNFDLSDPPQAQCSRCRIEYRVLGNSSG